MSENRAFPTRDATSKRVERGSLERRRCSVRTRRRRDSLRLHAILAGLAMRDDEREEVIGKPQE